MRGSLLLSGCLCLAAALWTMPRTAEEDAAASGAVDPRADAMQRLAGLPAAFVPNLGQWDFPARYVATIGGTSVCLEQSGILVGALERSPVPRRRGRSLRRPGEDDRVNDHPVRGAAVRLAFANAATPEFVPERVLAGHHDYFLGSDPSRWRTDVPLYGALRYFGIWPGVEVLCYAKEGCLEYDVVIAPGADLEAVELEGEGGHGLAIDGEGALVIHTAIGPLRQPRPVTYSLDAAGAQRPLAARYELRGKTRFGFVVPGWLGEEALVVDPGIMWSTYVGDRFTDAATALSATAPASSRSAG